MPQLAEASAVAGAGNRTLGTTAPAPANGVIPLQELEKRAIVHALRQTNGDRTTAASLLGIGRTTLYRKLKEYRIAG